MRRWSFIGQGRNAQLEGETKGSRRSPNRGGRAALRASGAAGERDKLASVDQRPLNLSFLHPEK